MTRMEKGAPGKVARSRDESIPSWDRQPRAGKGVPNIVIVYMDDLGYSDVGCYGGEISTPNIDALAQRGVRFNRYNTHPICSPARAALLTGKNAHAVGSGWLANNDPGFPGYSGEIAANAATLAETLRAHGYRTIMTGKWHNTPILKCLPSSPKDTWPAQRGFEYFYGFMEEETNYFFPARLMLNNAVLPMDRYSDDYYSTAAWTDAAIAYMKEIRASDKDVPFFLYVAHNAPHAPLQAPANTIANYAGRYDAGWDEARTQRLERQRQLGIVPPQTRLAPREAGVPAWADTPIGDRVLLARHMEVYAAVVEEADKSFGRLIVFLEELGELENTIIVFASDNGGSGAGGLIGAINNNRRFAGLPYHPAAEELERLDWLGGPRSAPLYPSGWGQVSNTPFPSFKTYTGAGGRRVPFIVSWPARMGARGEIRSQFVHVTDAMPTILDLANVLRLETMAGEPTLPLDGRSFAAAILDGSASTRNSQYFECWSQRAYYKDGWTAVSIQQRGAPIDMDKWTLHAPEDFSECVDVASAHPERLRELVEDFDRDAWINMVYPLDNRTVTERFREIPEYAREAADRTHTFVPGAQTVHRAVVGPLVDDRSFKVAARFDYASGNEGVLWSLGEQIGGMVLYIKHGMLHFLYNAFDEFRELPSVPLSAGRHSATLEYEALGARRGRGRLVVNDSAGEWEDLSPTLSVGFHEGLDVGIDRRAPVSWEMYSKHGSFPYGGLITEVTFVPGPRATTEPQPKAEASVAAS